MAHEAERMSRSSVSGRLGDWPTEPLHTHEPLFPLGLSCPGCGLSLFSLLEGQLAEQQEQPFAAGASPPTANGCDMQLIGQASRPKIVSSTWKVRNIEYAEHSVGRRASSRCLPSLSGRYYRHRRHEASTEIHQCHSVDCRNRAELILPGHSLAVNNSPERKPFRSSCLRQINLRTY